MNLHSPEINPEHAAAAADDKRQLEPYLVIGSKGMLGRAWVEMLKRAECQFTAVDLPECDVTDDAAVAHHLNNEVSTVINCCAFTDVDAAETNEEEARQLNAVAVSRLAKRAREVDATLVHYSTDYVFDGTGRNPYPIDAPRRPLGAYGRTKAEGERELEKSGARFLLIRTSWLYAPWGKNFVRTIANYACARSELKVVKDQRGRPTSAEHLARTSHQLLVNGASGIFHVTDGDMCSWFDLASEIVEQLGASCRIIPCTTAEFPRPAPRPEYSVLDLGATETVLGAMPTWQENLKAVMSKIRTQI